MKIFKLRVSALHRIHVETSGNMRGIPVVLLHGGPGGLPDPHDLTFFPEDTFFRVSFHQRGSGLSRPLGELRENTLDDLAEDVERIRHHLRIGPWVVFGGSFGSAVALRYAENHPTACRALILHSVMTGRPGFETWDFAESRSLFPECWQQMADQMPGPVDQPLAARCFTAILGGGRPATAATRAWYARSAALSNLSPACDLTDVPRQTVGQRKAAARLSAHYWMERLFLPPDTLLREAYRLANVPGAIIHGAEDHNCLVSDADELHRRWPKSMLSIVPSAGHSTREPRMAAAIASAVLQVVETGQAADRI